MKQVHLIEENLFNSSLHGLKSQFLYIKILTWLQGVGEKQKK